VNPVGPVSAFVFTYQGLEIEVRPGVFQPNRTTELLLDAVLQQDLTGKSVLDLGCGSGVVGITVAKLGRAASVQGSDISPEAVENARHNARRLGLEVEFRQGNLFQPWGGRTFDVIVDDVSGVAEPVARVSPWYPPEIVCDAGEDGTANSIRMLEEAYGHLNPGGVLFLPTVSLSDERKILEVARNMYDRVECLFRKSWPFKEDFWQRISNDAACRRLLDEGVIRVSQRGSRWTWDTSIFLCTRAA
jgi:methylase of polypeptide subunit release factors